MNRIYTTLFIFSLLLFYTSCKNDVINEKSPSMKLKTRTTEQNVQNLIQQARLGNAEAYKSLAICYSNGDGVAKSWLNMAHMYANYCDETGEDESKLFELLDGNHPYIKIYKIINSSLDDNITEKPEELKMYAPSKAKAINVAIKMILNKDTANILNSINEAESEGSELAILTKIGYYQNKNMDEEYERYLINVAEKHPFLYLDLGELYLGKYFVSDDYTNINKADEFYYKADAYGMLTSRIAHVLIDIYNNYGEKCQLSCDKQEIERLKKIANIKN